MTPGYLTVSQVAEHMAVSKMTVYRLIEDHVLPATRIGRLYRIHPDHLTQYLDEMSTTGDTHE